MVDEFDVQRRSPFTPEGEIESAGHFARGVASRFGNDRFRQAIGRAALGGAVLSLVLAVATMIG